MAKSIIQKSVRPPATNTDNCVPQWDGANSGLLKDGLLVGQANGLATLDEDGTIPTTQIPATVLGGMEYHGTWDFDDGDYPEYPEENSHGVAVEQGDYWIASAEATIGDKSYKVGDWLVYNGSGWDKIDNSLQEHDHDDDYAAITGTSSSVFQIGTNGPKWKNNSGELEAKNAADNDYVKIRVLKIQIGSFEITYNSNDDSLDFNKIV
jgi:hypothetical protein